MLPVMHGLSVIRIDVSRALRARFVRAVVLLSPLAGLGCSMGDDRMAMAYVDPATFRYYSCEQLEAAAKGTEAQQRQIEATISKAERGTGGALVSAVAYRADYLATVGNRRLIAEATKEKNCPPPPEPKATLR